MLSRRNFLRTLGAAGVGGAAGGLTAAEARGSSPAALPATTMGVLVDIPRCIGCRRCEYACQEAAGFAPPAMETFEDKSIFAEHRRPHPKSYTVINRYENPADASRPIYNKFNCLHCNDPACKSACLVSAFSKQADGAVVYNPSRCMGCRYCMVACPFEIPAYDYDKPLTPQVRKCNLCAHIVPGRQEVPACVKICPEEVLAYDRRDQLLELAHERIRQNPETYIDHVYGEHEAGGTSWLYISSLPFEKVGFRRIDHAAPPRLTESIQHSEFKFFLPPILLYGLLGAAMWMTRPNQPEEARQAGEHARAGKA